ncbi:NADH pyrophosphatase [Corynebacterium ciconiae DSM 44920]|uniref:NAD(+) diphosphatase n=1 Tax=Corynebacterium ciconiae TaxID=227319 RepID=UPI0003A23314|nr:NAD(+) diphosphatase [Corynebacterium ciconiae]WKD61774.1 NADH pyrophosphatase [Corynebacterium ciconiae DSM 44920]
MAQESTARYFLVGPQHVIACGLSGEELHVCGVSAEAIARRVSVDTQRALFAVKGEAQALACAEQLGARILGPGDPEFWHGSIAGHAALLRALALVEYKDNTHFDPADGSALDYLADSAQARGGSGWVFPRIDPAVIGVVELREQQRILVGRNAQRSQYFSLIAGYVEPGESVESAFIREVREETGRRVERVRYVASQPWPLSGSLMLGMYGTTSDVRPHSATDNELRETRWVSASDIREQRFPQPRAGSIAHSMMHAWAAGRLFDALRA